MNARMRIRGRTPRPARRQAGVSLAVALILLVVLMMMGTSATVVSNTQLRMAGNFQFQSIALANAEAGLSAAENWLPANNGNAGFVTRSAGGLYPVGTAPDPLAITWDDSNSVKVDAAGAQRFMIEMIANDRVLPSNSTGDCNVYGTSGPCPRVNLFRLTARGTSAIGATRIVQSVFAVRINI